MHFKNSRANLIYAYLAFIHIYLTNSTREEGMCKTCKEEKNTGDRTNEGGSRTGKQE